VICETPKAKDHEVSFCDGCLKKQRLIGRQTEEIQRFKQKLDANERQLKEDFFASSA